MRCGGCGCSSKEESTIPQFQPTHPPLSTSTTRQTASRSSVFTQQTHASSRTSYVTDPQSVTHIREDKKPPAMASKQKSKSVRESPQTRRPRPTRSSRTFKDSSEHELSSLLDLEDSSNRSNLRRSTSYASPLEFLDPAPLYRRSTPLTRQNLESLLKDLEKAPSSAPQSVKSGTQQDPPGPTLTTASRSGDKAMPKTKSPKKSDKKKSKADADSHPLNLPPDELRRLSAAMAKEEARTSTPMDVDDAPAVNGSSQPPTPSHDAPGTFPDEETNGVNVREEKSPTPPPHRTPPPPKVDPEACKAAGNKFFKAKDYDRAVQEYSKGKSTLHVS